MHDTVKSLIDKIPFTKDHWDVRIWLNWPPSSSWEEATPLKRTHFHCRRDSLTRQETTVCVSQCYDHQTCQLLTTSRRDANCKSSELLVIKRSPESMWLREANSRMITLRTPFDIIGGILNPQKGYITSLIEYQSLRSFASPLLCRSNRHVVLETSDDDVKKQWPNV